MIIARKFMLSRLELPFGYLALQRFGTQDPIDSDDDFKKTTKVQLTEENAQQLIQKWISSNDIVLFMKGTPLAPQCGYSNYVVETLKKYGIIEYKSINVLENPIIREQAKLFSKWPTYPQLYIKGELVGGSDILQEMHKDGSLQKLLSEKSLL